MYTKQEIIAIIERKVGMRATHHKLPIDDGSDLNLEFRTLTNILAVHVHLSCRSGDWKVVYASCGGSNLHIRKILEAALI